MRDLLGSNSPGGNCPAGVFSVGILWEEIFQNPQGLVMQKQSSRWKMYS